MPDTLVFIPAWNEEESLPDVLAEARRELRTADGGYEYCGRLDADGQHPAAELARMLALVRADDCDVAVGSRFLPHSGGGGERYRPAPERVVGTSLLRLLMRLRLGQPISDGTSGMYAVNRSALEQREHGESSFRGRRAVELIVTIALTLFAGELLRRRHQRRRRASGLRGLFRRS